jgi:two-component system cell cycle sensor histidine kinase/response regulator CckA
MNSDRISRKHPRPSARFQILLTAVCLFVPLTVGWCFRGSHESLALFPAFSWLCGVLAAALWGGYVPGVAVVVLFHLLLPPLISHKLATDYNGVMRTILLAGVSLMVSWTASVRRRSEAVLRTANEDLENRVGVRTAELAAAREWLETTLASIGDAVVATNADGKVTFMNPVAANLTGWSEREAVGKSLKEIFNIVNEYTREPAVNPVTRALETGRAQGLANHTVLISRSGKEYAIDDSASPIRDNSTRVTGAVLVFRDISARRAAERQRERLLEEARAASADAERRRSQIHSLFMQSPVIINIHRGPEHTFELVHPGMAAFLDCDSAVGAPARQAIPQQYRAIFVDSLDASFRSGEPRVVEEAKITLRDEREAWYSFIHHPWRDLDGSTAGIMTLALDVTEQIRTRLETQTTQERLRETAKLESLGVLAGGIAHDFNNLLVGIMGNASLVFEMLDSDDPARDAVENLLKAAERAAQLTHQMLAYSGKGRFFIEPLDLRRAVEELLPLITPSISRSVRLSLDLPPSLPSIDADRAQMQQLLMNLVINAAEAYEGRPGVVAVSACVRNLAEGEIQSLFGLSQPAPGPYVCVEVSDKGTGMSEETRTKVFDPFFTTKFAGRGLGLSAVLGIIRAHSGAIEVETEHGTGTTFRVYFPPSAAMPRLDEPEPAITDLRGAGTILLVDDEETVRTTATSALESYGYRVVTAYDGECAIDIFRRDHEKVSLVVLDLTMPVLDGEAVLERLREIDSEVPVILSSGFSATEATRRFEGKHLSGFLQKPYTAQSLAQSVKNALGTGTSFQTA